MVEVGGIEPLSKSTDDLSDPRYLIGAARFFAFEGGVAFSTALSVELHRRGLVTVPKAGIEPATCA